MLLHSYRGGHFGRLVCLFGILLLLASGRAQAYIYYVTPKGKDTNSGRSWAAAKATVQGALNVAVAGDQIWVAAGTYSSSQTINMVNSVALYGGFNGTETQLGQRNFVKNVTILDGAATATPLVYFPNNTSINTRIDGFTLQNSASNGIEVTGGSAMVTNNNLSGFVNGTAIFDNNNQDLWIEIANNMMIGDQIGVNIQGYGSVTIVGNTIRDTSNGAGIQASGTYVDISGNTVTNGSYDGIEVSGTTVLVTNNIVTGNAYTGISDGGGYIINSNLTITQNTVSLNGAGGISLTFESGQSNNWIIANNIITENTTGTTSFGYGGGIYLAGYNSTSSTGGPGSVSIKDNLIANNSAIYGGGIAIYDTDASVSTNDGGITVANNTLAGNAAAYPQYGGGIGVGNDDSTLQVNLANNLVAFNSSGINASGTTLPTLTTNDFYGSTYNNYDGISPGPTDISAAPLFFDATNLNFHLAATSPCIDAGTDSFVSAGDTDLDGNPRIYGAHVDIGCYEWTPSAYPDLAEFVMSPGTLCTAQSATGQIVLTSAALAPGAAVQLSSTNPTIANVPTSVIVPMGAATVFFTVTANAVATAQTTTISATYRGITQSVSLTVEPLMAAITLSPAAVTGAATITGTIDLNAPAPSGTTLTLSSSDPAVTVSPSVNVPANATSVTFTATTTAVTTSRIATISATYGPQTLSAPVGLDPSGQLKAISVAPNVVTGGQTAVGVVTLTAAAPAGGIVIPIYSSSSAASIPATVTIPVGKRSVSFPVTTGVVTAAQTVTLTASLGTTTLTTKLKVAPAAIASLALLPSTVQGGENSIGIITLAAPVGVPVTITLAGNATASPDITTLIIPAGYTQGVFNISTVTVSKSTNVPIKATLYGASKSAILTVTP